VRLLLWPCFLEVRDDEVRWLSLFSPSSKLRLRVEVGAWGGNGGASELMVVFVYAVG